MPNEPPRFLTAEWRHLVMLNFEVDPKVLERRVPAGVELDFWNGRTYVSLVGFRFLNTKLFGVALPLHRNFCEVNLRFYVRRQFENSWRRGVVFIKEIVPLAAVTFVARRVYNENYVTLPMRHTIHLPRSSDEPEGSVEYSWKWRSQWLTVAADVSGSAQPPEIGSEEQFIAEHFWGYTMQNDGGTIEYQVDHPSWRVWRAASSRFTRDIASFYGPEFVDCLSSSTTSAFVAEGSEIVVRKGIRLS